MRGGGSGGAGGTVERVSSASGRRTARRAVGWLGASMAVLLVGTVAYGGYWYHRIDHNFSKAPLHAAEKPVTNVVTETPDAFGALPLNILVIGTDARLTAADQAIGGDGGPNGRGDVEMLVHVSADRSNATVVSIPRDTMVPIPDCTDPKGGTVPGRSIDMINSALAGGPGCQVDAVEHLTHVQIDHFIMVDFAGVVALTDAVGGVQVCVTTAVNDADSHLTLPAGTSTVVGDQALAFLRTREGFANGSDLYRTQAQHQYLSSLIRKMKDQATLDDPVRLLNLADVASKALTLDPGIAGVSKLLDLEKTMKQVPTNRITFMTMPTGPYQPDPNRVAPSQPLDDQIFTLLAHDESVTAPSQSTATGTPGTGPTPVPTPSGAATIDPAAVADPVVVENGTTANGRSKDVAAVLTADGFKNATGIGYGHSDVATTEVFYSPGHQASAEAVAQALRLPDTAVRPGSDGNGAVVLRVGNDFTSGPTFGLGSGPTVQAPAPTALPSDAASSAAAENASDASMCVQAYNGG